MSDSKKNRLVLEAGFLYDLEQIMGYFIELKPELAHQINHRIFQSLALLETFPALGYVIDESAQTQKRCWIIDGYVVLYTYEETTIYLNRIIDQRLDYTRYM